jgi:hypothetical protein
MTTINSSNAKSLDSKSLDLALNSLAIRLAENQAAPIEFVIGGGSALILTGMIPRTTKDVDVVAMIRGGVLYSRPIRSPRSFKRLLLRWPKISALPRTG